MTSDLDQHTLVPLDSPMGRDWFTGALGTAQGLRLLQHYVTQDTLTYCGVATAVMLLNAMGVPRPPAERRPPYQLFTQEPLLNGSQDGEVFADKVRRAGVSLDEFSRWFDRDDVKAQQVYAADLSVDDFRGRLRDAFGPQSSEFIAVNYPRKGVGQEGGGHFSPLAAFHTEADRVLILDVARYRYPPVWVGVTTLFEAMSTQVDPDTGRSRGFLVASAA